MANKNNNLKYGLEIKPKEIKEFQKPSIFDESSSSDEEDTKIPTLSFSSNFKKQDTSKLEKALEEDESIFEYDNVFDKISTAKVKKEPAKQKKKLASAFKESADKKNLRFQIVQSKKAKMENEVDKKEVFVTSAYKKEQVKLLELAKEDHEQEEREKKYELTKETGTSAIYRYMFNTKLNSSSKQVDILNKTAPSVKDKPDKVEEIIQPKETEKENSPEEDDIVKLAMKAKSVREKASLLMQKPDTSYMRQKYAKKTDESTVQTAKERYLLRKQATKRAVVEDSDSE